ncbi:hypothetical protein SSX86_014092 [Deinandra increscens subsp. villosa]|uniref:PUM-HD domain-containing protein n=1 Tax=Deinandra increscens subsp. villosa TaxID=3103831 RepID=A0AAP0D1M1_9ASTR
MIPNHPHHHHHMYQTQSPTDFSDGFPFHSVSPARLNNISPSIDIDQSFYDSLSSLNISNHDDQDRQVFLPPRLNRAHGGAGSPFRGEGFGSNNGFEESFRASNGVSYNQGVYSGVGHSSARTVDPFLQQRTSSSSRFDLDFDQMSYLLAKERLYPTQLLNSYRNLRSINHPASISDESGLNLQTRNYNRNPNLQNYSYFRHVSLHDLRGRIRSLAKDEIGSKILQSKFDTPTSEEIDIVFSEVVGSVSDLMKDPHANYLMQKLVSVCDDNQKAMIIRELTDRSDEIILVCMSQYGTRVVQKLLENLTSHHQLMKVIRALQPCAAQLANDPNGHHVLQFCLLHFGCDYNQPILNQIANNCFKVATDRSGCCVLQACVEHSHGEVRTRLISEIMANAIQIAEDPFGNYVLQHMVGLQSPELTALLVSQLQGNFAYLSQNKYASNVVEKCLIESGPDISANIILELVESPTAPSLLVDPYGNFVIQSALKVSKGFAFSCLRRLILGNVHSMQSNLYGKKILEKMEKKRIIHS